MPVKRVGRRRFTLFYLGVLVLKIISLFAVSVAMALLKTPVAYLFFTLAVAWLLLDFCLWSIYRGRLVDVDMSPYCLLLLYGGMALWLVLPLLIPDDPQKETGWLFQPTFFLVCGGLGLVWMIALVLRVFLIFKKGEPHGEA